MAVDEFSSKEKPKYVFIAAAKGGGIQATNTHRVQYMYIWKHRIISYMQPK